MEELPSPNATTCLTKNLKTLFQQDGVQAHYIFVARALFDEKCRIYGLEMIVQQFGRCSPDLPTSDFFLCGFVKDWVYGASFSNVTQLNRRITSAIRALQANVPQNAWKTLMKD